MNTKKRLDWTLYAEMILTARKRSLGQGNIFTGICLSTGGRRHAWQGSCMAGGMHHRGYAWPRGLAWQGGGACMAWGHAWQGGMRVWRERDARAGEMATEAGGTHPTGMNSFLKFFQ